MAKAQNVYEGSDSDELEIEEKPPVVPEVPEVFSDDESSDELPLEQQKAFRTNSITAPKPFKPFVLGYTPRVGELCREDEQFCTFQLVKSYPYQYIGKANRQRVDDTFFNQGKVFENSWDLFYLHRNLLELEGYPPPLILVTTRQFIHFLAKINKHFKTKLAIPDGANGAFEVLFGDEGTPRPRYLGQVNSKLAMDKLIYKVPSWRFKLDGEPEMPKVLTDDGYEIFRNNVALAQQKQAKKAVAKDKAAKTRIHNQKSYRQTIKRVQRYLGLRQAQGIHSNPQNTISDPKTIKAATYSLQNLTFDPNFVTNFAQENSVVFVCVDVEAYERDARIITEIGFATLDTKDLLLLAPGERGVNWRSLIRPRHFRISEHKFYNNSDYVAGCADRFEFGTSEFISIKDASDIISDCFKNPVPKTGDADTKEQSNRKVIFVGHDVISDIKFLRTVGYDVYTLPNLFDMVDTALMYRALRREMNTRSLGVILTDMGITGWNLHNAGNDAVYTLQVMIAMAIKYLEERQNHKKTESLGRNPKKSSSSTLEKADAWSSSEDSDGGLPNLFHLSFPDYNAGKRNKKTPVQIPRATNPWTTGSQKESSSSQSALPRTSNSAKSPEFSIMRNTPREW
ncbi:putative qde-2-interacting protein [Erysiphe neolycopersici]|uniref:Putative qde-2-interacting protein n=1 Tax=Erysiphe neolycopersici TaxID=212602 RepID=A0A420HZS6_9PEZI|nr:putative qde-2-interacting protein [Erysiphe neolycopersici]